VSTLIHLYSYGYMQSDEGFDRYFSYLNFFVFSMLLLVLAGNFVLLIVGWAFVGFASYALISFWYRRTTATTAGMKAFVINVIGDGRLVVATFCIFPELRRLRCRVGVVRFRDRLEGRADRVCREGAVVYAAVADAAASRQPHSVAARPRALAAGRDGGQSPGGR